MCLKSNLDNWCCLGGDRNKKLHNSCQVSFDFCLKKMKEDHYFNNNLAIIEQVDEHKHEAKTELTKEMVKMDKVCRYWL